MTPEAAEVARLAQNLARNCGYAVFPSHPDKCPACPHGFKDAARDADVIAELWRQHPGELVGIATGERSDIDVLDVDAKHDAARHWWRSNQQRLPATRTFRTRNGGMHLYFVHAAGVTTSRGRLPIGCDVRGEGGYAISWFAAGHECLDHSPPTRWPDWLLAEILPKPRPAPPQRMHDRDNRAGVEGILRLVAQAPEGNRNSALHWAACRFGERVHAAELGPHDAEALLVAAATAAGLPEREARATIKSGLGRTS